MYTLKRIKKFCLHSYETDRAAFACELVSLVFAVIASLMLALTAEAPNMAYIYPGFFVSCTAATYGYYKRKLAWPMILTSYYMVVNIFGMGVVYGVW